MPQQTLQPPHRRRVGYKERSCYPSGSRNHSSCASYCRQQRQLCQPVAEPLHHVRSLHPTRASKYHAGTSQRTDFPKLRIWPNLPQPWQRRWSVGLGMPNQGPSSMLATHITTSFRPFLAHQCLATLLSIARWFSSLRCTTYRHSFRMMRPRQETVNMVLYKHPTEG